MQRSVGSRKGVDVVLTREQKAQIIKEYGQSPDDTGSSPVQIALLSERISYLTEHLRANKGDMSSRRGLLKLVGQRRRLLAYIRRKNYTRYSELADSLNIRKK